MPAEKITVATTVSLSAERAWRIYTDPTEITQWNFAT